MAAVLGRHIHTYTHNSDHTKQHCRNKRWSLLKPELLWGYTYTHTLSACSHYDSWGRIMRLSLLTDNPPSQPRPQGKSPGDEVATQPRKGWPHHRGLRSKSAIGVSVFYVRQEPDERNLHSHGKAPLGRGWSNNSTLPKDHTGSTTPTRAIMIPSI